MISHRDTIEETMQYLDEVIEQHKDGGKYAWILETRPALLHLIGRLEKRLELLKEE